MNTSEIKKGIVRTLWIKRENGMIMGEDGENYFFHRAGFRGTWENLREGDRVTFEVIPSAKGVKAVGVRLERIGGE